MVLSRVCHQCLSGKTLANPCLPPGGSPQIRCSAKKFPCSYKQGIYPQSLVVAAALGTRLQQKASKSRKFPVFSLISRELSVEHGSRRTAPTTSQSPRLSILHRIRRKRPNSGPGGPADQGLISPPTPWRAPPCSRQKHLASLVRLGPADARDVIGADGKPLCCQYCLNDYREFSCSFLKPPRVPGSHRYLW